MSEAVSFEPTLWAMLETMGVVATVPSSLESALSLLDKPSPSALAAESVDDMSTLCSEIWTG